MKNKLSNLIKICLLILLCFHLSIFTQPEFNFPGGFSYVINTPLNEVFDLTPDGSKAAVITPAETGPNGNSQITIIDSVSGQRLDSKITNGGSIAVKVGVLNDVIKVIALTDVFGNKFITIYDLDENGILTQRANTQLNNNPGVSIQGSNIVISPATRTGFVSLSSGNIRLISFDLDTGTLLQTLVTPVSSNLNLFEDATRRFLIGGFNRNLVFIDYSNPSDLREIGTVTLPSTGDSFGTFQISTVFSEDGNYVFAGNGYSQLSAIDTSSRLVLDSIDSRYRANQIKIHEEKNNRFIVLKSLEDGQNVLKGHAIIDANNPSELNVLNEIVFGEQIFSKRDFAISQNGNRLFIASEGKLTAFRIPNLNQIWETPLSAFATVRLTTFGNPERIFGAWLNKIYSVPDFTNITANFDSDGKTDLSVFRPKIGVWFWQNSSDGIVNAFNFGQVDDTPISGDFDGDGISDFVVFRRSINKWFIYESATDTVQEIIFGRSGDQLVPSDYDGDNKTDIAVFRRNPNRWIIRQSSDGGYKSIKFGFGSGNPIVGDFDGDNLADFVYFDTSGRWQIKYSNGIIDFYQFGLNGDIPISGDFDLDGKNDVAVFRPSNQVWYIQQSYAGFKALQFGLPNDELVPADYDADGKTDIAVFRPSDGVWYILQSSNGVVRFAEFGLKGDIPIPIQ